MEGGRAGRALEGSEKGALDGGQWGSSCPGSRQLIGNGDAFAGFLTLGCEGDIEIIGSAGSCRGQPDAAGYRSIDDRVLAHREVGNRRGGTVDRRRRYPGAIATGSQGYEAGQS